MAYPSPRNVDWRQEENSSEDESYDDDFESIDSDDGISCCSSPAEVEQQVQTQARANSSCSRWKVVVNFDKEILLGHRIGGGGMGVVYRGWYKNELVAVKTYFDPKMSPELRNNFANELRIMSSLHHPNIIKLLGSSTTPPKLCFVMELCRNSLFDLLHNNNPNDEGQTSLLLGNRRKKSTLSKRRKLQICLEVARGMTYLHSLSIVHRDLKPHNVLLSRDEPGTVRLCDFGISHSKEMNVGTPHYMAPELWGGCHQSGGCFTAAVDVYSFAIVMWEVFAEKIPFHGYDVREIKKIVCRGDRLPLSDLGHFLESCRDLIENCWSPTPCRRLKFSTCVDKLEKLINEMGCKEEDGLIDNIQGHCDALDDIMNTMRI